MARSKLIRCATVAIVALLGWDEVQSADADGECVYSVNFDVRLSPGENYRHQASRRVQVYEGHTIPVVFKDYRLDLRVSGIDNRKYLVELRLFERTDGSTRPKPGSTYWQINPTPIEISGRFSHPLQFQTAIAGVELDLAIAIEQCAS